MEEMTLNVRIKLHTVLQNIQESYWMVNHSSMVFQNNLQKQQPE